MSKAKAGAVTGAILGTTFGGISAGLIYAIMGIATDAKSAKALASICFLSVAGISTAVGAGIGGRLNFFAKKSFDKGSHFAT